jgi:hypothetical protein
MADRIRRGTAARLGLHPQLAPRPLADISTPDGGVHRLAAVGSRGRATYVNQRGGVAARPAVTVTAEMIRYTRPVLAWEVEGDA